MGGQRAFSSLLSVDELESQDFASSRSPPKRWRVPCDRALACQLICSLASESRQKLSCTHQTAGSGAVIS